MVFQMRRLFIISGLLLFMGVLSGEAQRIIYVSSVKGQDYGAGTFASPYMTIARALNDVSGETEIRVMEGEYHLTKELVIPAGVTLLGGYRQDVDIRWRNAAEKTILIGTGKTRVVNLAGVLDGVTVRDGFAQGQNGGGVYVKSGGKVKNCIITENKASYRFPKVGDLLMKDKSYLDVTEFTYDIYDKVLGVICWVNTDQGAEPGQQGLAVSTDFIMNASWNIVSTSLTVVVSAVDEEAAMTDMNGKEHTDALVTKATGAKWCREKGDEWIFPSLGMLGIVATEWDRLEKTFRTLYDEMYRQASPAALRSFFGEFITNTPSYKDAHHYMRQEGVWGSSTLRTVNGKKHYWGLNAVMGDCEITSFEIRTSPVMFGMIKF